MAVAGDAAVGDACGVKELGVDALVALAGALVAREAAFGRAPVEAVVVLQLVERPVVEPQRILYSEPFVCCLHWATASLTICVTLGRAAAFTVTSAVVRR